MEVSLDNQSESEFWVTVSTDDVKAAREDQTIDGSRWEVGDSGTFAYTVLMDRPGLVDELRSEGYELDLSCYSPPVWRETLWGLVDEETGTLVHGEST